MIRCVEGGWICIPMICSIKSGKLIYSPFRSPSMVLCRCLEEHGYPQGRSRKYVAYVKPIGYPRSSLICGNSQCEKPAVIWLDELETQDYERRERVFSGSHNFVKVQADDSGLHCVKE